MSVKWFTFVAKSSPTTSRMQNAAIAEDALENLSGIDVVSVDLVFGDQAEDGGGSALSPSFLIAAGTTL